jgi:hypothetical protein
MLVGSGVTIDGYDIDVTFAAPFLTTTVTTALANERYFADGNLITHTDGGAGGAWTVQVDPNKLQVTAGKLIKSDTGTLTLQAAGAYTGVVPAGGTFAMGANTVGVLTGNIFTGALHTHAVAFTQDGDPNMLVATDASANIWAQGLFISTSGGYMTYDQTLGGSQAWNWNVNTGVWRLNSPTIGSVISSSTAGTAFYNSVQANWNGAIQQGFALYTEGDVVHLANGYANFRFTSGIALVPSNRTGTVPSFFIKNGGTLNTSNYVSQLTGWRITAFGEADFRYVFADEMHVKVFIADLEQALAGGQIIAKSVAVIAQNFVCPDPLAVTFLYVEDLPGASNMQVFQSGDIVRVQSFTRVSGGLNIGRCFGVVTSYADGTGLNGIPEGQQRWTFTRSVYPDSGLMATGTVVEAKSLAIDFGVSGNGYYEVSAVDGLWGSNAPYAQIVSWTGHPRSGLVLNGRFGRLSGIGFSDAQANEYGLYAGDGVTQNDQYIRISNYTAQLNNIDFSMYSAGIRKLYINVTSPYIGLGNPAPTGYLQNTGFWVGDAGGSLYKFHIGTTLGGVLQKGISWDSNELQLLMTGGAVKINVSGISLQTITDTGWAFDGTRALKWYTSAFGSILGYAYGVYSSTLGSKVELVAANVFGAGANQQVRILADGGNPASITVKGNNSNTQPNDISAINFSARDYNFASVPDGTGYPGVIRFGTNAYYSMYTDQRGGFRQYDSPLSVIGNSPGNFVAQSGFRAHISVGDVRVGYIPSSGAWSLQSSIYGTLVLNGAGVLGSSENGAVGVNIAMHQSGLRVDNIYMAGTVLHLGYDGGFGNPEVRTVGTLSSGVATGTIASAGGAASWSQAMPGIYIVNASLIGPNTIYHKTFIVHGAQSNVNTGWSEISSHTYQQGQIIPNNQNFGVQYAFNAGSGSIFGLTFTAGVAPNVPVTWTVRWLRLASV